MALVKIMMNPIMVVAMTKTVVIMMTVLMKWIWFLLVPVVMIMLVMMIIVMIRRSTDRHKRQKKRNGEFKVVHTYMHTSIHTHTQHVYAYLLTYCTYMLYRMYTCIRKTDVFVD